MTTLLDPVGLPTIAHPAGLRAVTDRRLHDMPIRLGFGTAWLPAEAGAAQSLLDLALESGIRYFDTARMYGSGRAEAQIAPVLRGLSPAVRDTIVLATKLGITPQSGAFHARAARRIAAALGRNAPDFALPHRHRFTPAEMADSLEASFGALGVDRVDILLLHEVAPDDLTGEALRWLEDQITSGRVGRLGLATSLEQSLAILVTSGGRFDVVQLADNAWDRTTLKTAAEGRLAISHSLLIDRFRDLQATLADDATLRREWSHALDFDAEEPGALAGVFLRHALASNARGVVLFSTTNPIHLRNNVRWAQLGPLDEARMRQFERLIA